MGWLLPHLGKKDMEELPGEGVVVVWFLTQLTSCYHVRHQVCLFRKFHQNLVAFWKGNPFCLVVSFALFSPRPLGKSSNLTSISSNGLKPPARPYRKPRLVKYHFIWLGKALHGATLFGVQNATVLSNQCLWNVCWINFHLIEILWTHRFGFILDWFLYWNAFMFKLLCLVWWRSVPSCSSCSCCCCCCCCCCCLFCNVPLKDVPVLWFFWTYFSWWGAQKVSEPLGGQEAQGKDTAKTGRRERKLFTILPCCRDPSTLS